MGEGRRWGRGREDGVERREGEREEGETDGGRERWEEMGGGCLTKIRTGVRTLQRLLIKAPRGALGDRPDVGGRGDKKRPRSERSPGSRASSAPSGRATASPSPRVLCAPHAGSPRGME